MLLGTFIWGALNVWKNVLMKQTGAHPHTANVYEMTTASIVPLTVACMMPGGLTVTSGFLSAFLVTGTLNILMEHWNAKANSLEEPSLLAAVSGTMPAIAVPVAWWINHMRPSPWAYLGIPIVAGGIYLLKVDAAGVELPSFLKAVLPTRTHSFVSYYFGPLIRVFFDFAGKRLPIFEKVPILGKWTFNGAQFAWLISWTAAISTCFDLRMVRGSNVMLHAGLCWGLVAIFWYLVSRSTGEWKALDKSHRNTFLFVGALRGILTVLVNVALMYSDPASVGALKRINIVWTTLFAGLFLKEAPKGGKFALRMCAVLIILLGICMIDMRAP